ncbi:peptidoglycan-binding protein [Streptomyces sp. NPDC059786]|uniref:peptidoglycan-binding domain-containing protein n=1 Tax=Streptomyces sp. NPDC059786 TaxID=3346946 RepID=UPI0036624707
MPLPTATSAPAPAQPDAPIDRTSLPSADRTTPLPAPLHPENPAERTMALRPTAPAPEDLRLFQEPVSGPGAAGEPPVLDDAEPPRRRRTTLLAVAGVLVAVLAAAGFVAGLLSYDSPERDGAPPEAVRAEVPDESPSESAPVSPSSSPSASASASATESSSASASPSRSAASASPSAESATPTATPSTTRATDSAGTSPSDDEEDQSGPVLRRGDRGSEVTELQLRLRQLALYIGDADGHYGRQTEDAVRRYQWARGIRADEQGVYGAATRAGLESETEEP